MKAEPAELENVGDKRTIDFCLELIEAGQPISQIIDALRQHNASDPAPGISGVHEPSIASARRAQTRRSSWLICAAIVLLVAIVSIASVHRPNVTAAEKPGVEVASAPIPPAYTLTGPSPDIASSAKLEALTERGSILLGAGDISAARSSYERAAVAGNAQAAMYLALTYDPLFLKQARFGKAVQANRELAEYWYRRAQELRSGAQNRG